MGLFSSVIGSLASSAFDGLSSLGSSAFQSQQNKSLMKYQYELNQRSLEESPSAQKRGLIAAGYNPMLALSGSVTAPSVSGSSVSAPDLRPDFNTAFTASKQRELMDAQKDDVESSAELKRAQTDIAKAQSAADVALKTAEAEKIRKESAGIDPEVIQRSKKYHGHFGDMVHTAYEGLLDFGSGFRSLLPASSPSSSTVPSTPSSARQVKVISDEQNREEKRRGDAVRNRRRHH